MMYQEDRGQNPFEEQVGVVAQALDDIRYADGVEYKHDSKAESVDGVQEDLSEEYEMLSGIMEQADELDYDELSPPVRELVSSVEAFGEQGADTYESLMDYFGSFEDVKYDGETESGPGALVVMVDGPAEAFAEYANEKKKGAKDATKHGTYWGKEGLEPSVYEEDLAQMIYDTSVRNDGAIIIGEDGFLPQTYWVPDAEAPEDAYSDVGGTKHDAGVNATYADILDENGEDVSVESLVLSAERGSITRFQRDQSPMLFPYDGEEQPRVPKFWEGDVSMETLLTDGGERMPVSPNASYQ